MPTRWHRCAPCGSAAEYALTGNRLLSLKMSSTCLLNTSQQSPGAAKGTGAINSILLQQCRCPKRVLTITRPGKANQ